MTKSQEIEVEGYDAQRRGIALDANPYSTASEIGAESHRLWAEGWKRAEQTWREEDGR